VKRSAKSRWLSPTEAAAYASQHFDRTISTKTIDRWLVQGLPYARIAGVTVRIQSSDLDTWLARLNADEWRAPIQHTMTRKR
jgi:hypothetical protein